jgi:FkbM family methyltransferase
MRIENEPPALMLLFNEIRALVRRAKRLGRVMKGQDIWVSADALYPYRVLGNERASWAVCLDLINASSIVYSAGVGTDISFDCELIKRTSAKVFAFDPTPRSIDWLRGRSLPTQFAFFDYGLADFDGVAEFAAPTNPTNVSYSVVRKDLSRIDSIRAQVKKVSTIMRAFGHEYIDVLKMDIEGSEYSVIDSLLSERLPIRQILVEFHHRFLPSGVQKTKGAVEALRLAGYKIFFVSDTGEEYSFIRP